MGVGKSVDARFSGPWRLRVAVALGSRSSQTVLHMLVVVVSGYYSILRKQRIQCHNHGLNFIIIEKIYRLH